MKQLLRASLFIAIVFGVLAGCQSTQKPSNKVGWTRIPEGALAERIENPNWRGEPPLPMKSGAFDGSGLEIIPHPTYLAMELPFPPFKDLHRQLQTKLGIKLLNRGEAHVTVITPPEFSLLKGKISINEISAIAERMEIQKSKLQPVCVGRGQAVVDGKLEQTYFVVVQAPNLVEIRRAVRNLFRERGGGDFESDRFYPHVTVGFTKADLHENQGVIKGLGSCMYALAPRP